MPLRRFFNTFTLPSPSRPSCEDVVMTDATTSDISTPPCHPSAPTSPRKRCHEESSEHDSRPTASTSPKVTCKGPSSPLAAHPSTPVTPQRIRPNLALNTTDATSTDPSSSSHPPEPASPVPTEIATDLPVVELTAEERRESLRAAGIKVRDFAYDSVLPNARKAPEVFDPVPSLIAADWHMRNPHKNYGLLTPKGLFRLVKIGWLTLAEVGRHFSPVEFAMLKEYNDRPDEERYPFVVPARERMPTPSRRVRMRRKAGLTIHWDDYPDSKFFGYNPTGCSDDEDAPPSPPRVVPGSAATAEADADADASSRSASMVRVGPEPEPEPAEPKAKRRKVRGTMKTRSRGRGKPLRREFSRPEV